MLIEKMDIWSFDTLTEAAAMTLQESRRNGHFETGETDETRQFGGAVLLLLCTLTWNRQIEEDRGSSRVNRGGRWHVGA